MPCGTADVTQVGADDSPSTTPIVAWWQRFETILQRIAPFLWPSTDSSLYVRTRIKVSDQPAEHSCFYTTRISQRSIHNQSHYGIYT